MPTACLKCEHFLNISQQGSTEWYYCLCKARPRQLIFDPITGQYTRQAPEFHYCRDINHGNCRYFKPISKIPLTNEKICV